jgi:hypothetical protein
MFARGGILYTVLWTLLAIIVGVGGAAITVRGVQDGVAFYNHTQNANVSTALATTNDPSRRPILIKPCNAAMLMPTMLP